MTPKAQNAISVQDISVLLKTPFFMKTNGKRMAHWALKNVNFSVKRGQVFGVIGRNGSGKSTLLRTLARIIMPDKGKVVTYGRKPQLLSLNFSFRTHLSGRDNTTLMGLYYGLAHKDAMALHESVQSFSELGEWYDQPISTYSSGMRSRLGFAVAIQTQAEIILLDEVLSVGDIAFKEKAAKSMKDLIASNKTVVLVSNNPDTIKQHCSQALWLDNGHQVMIGTAPDVATAYKDKLCQNTT